MQAHEESHSQEPSASQRISTVGRPRVLVVDDDELVLRAFEREFRPLHLQVETASSAKEALARLEENDGYAVVISDLRMPGMDGINLLDRIRGKYPDIQRILISGQAEFEDAVRVINRVGLFSFFAKPWEPGEVRETVLKAAHQYAILQENRRLNEQIVVKNSQLEELNRGLELKVQERTTSMLLGMVNALDLRDTETSWHSRRVALFAHRLAEELGIRGDDLLQIERGALLHDIGKIGVSDTILLKPGKLTDEEWEEMRKHSEYGYQIIENIEFLGDARLLVWQHHERWDGRGYPNELEGIDICIGARIFSIIDTYDAMTSDRPYRKALPHEVAIEEIQKNAGSQFDPDVVAAFLRIPRRELDEIRERAFEETAGLD